MTVRQLAEGIAKDAGLLQDETRLVNEVTEYAELRDGFVTLRTALANAVDFAGVLSDAGIPGERLAPPSSALRDLAALAPNGEFVNSPLANARKPIKELEQWARHTTTACKTRYQEWCDSTLPNLEAAEGLEEQLRKVDAKAATRIRISLADARLARLSVPHSIDEIDRVRKLGEDIRVATTDFAPTQAAADFLVAALNRGAPLDLLTSDVRTWVQEKGFWPSLRILFRDADD